MIFGKLTVNDDWKRGYIAGTPRLGPAALLPTFPVDHETLEPDERPVDLDQYYGAILTLDWTLMPLASAPLPPNNTLVIVMGDEAAFTAWNASNNLVTIVDEADLGDYSDWEQASHARGEGADPKERWQSRLQGRRGYKRSKIDQRTKALIDAGFEYPPASGQIFSLSLPAQLTWLGMYQTRAALTYPVSVSTKNDQTIIELADEAAVEAFYAAGVATVRSSLDSGTALKVQLNAAGTEVDIEDIEDNR